MEAPKGITLMIGSPWSQQPEQWLYLRDRETHLHGEAPVLLFPYCIMYN